jgi:uncharacterized repeat protein (TIGR01451 family)
VHPGDTVSYTTTVTNNGPDPAKTVTFTINFPAGLNFTGFGAFTGAFKAGDSCSNDGAGHITCYLANLAPGATAGLTGTTATATALGTQTVTATTTSATTDPNPANNTATVSTTVN